MKQVSLRPALNRLAVVLGWCGATAVWAGPQLAIGTGAGDTTSIVPVTFTSDVPSVAVQFDVLFDAARLVSGPALPVGAYPNQQVVSSEPVPGTRRVVVYSANNAVIPNGVVVNLQFTPISQSADGPVALTAANVLVANAAAGSVKPVQTAPGTFTIGAVARFSSVSVTPAGLVQLELTGPPGRTFALQKSADLLQWSAVSTNPIPAGGVVTLGDPTAVASQVRFYRAVLR